MTRRILALVFTVFLLFSLTACRSVVCKTDQCEIYKQGSKYYLKFPRNSASGSEGSASSSQIAHLPTASTIAEMKQKVASANFTKEEVETLRSYAKDGVLELNRLDKWYEPVLPHNASVTSVYWYGDSYTIDFQADGILGYIRVWENAETYNALFKDEYTDYFSRDTFEIISQETVEERKATVTDFTTFAGRLKDIRYLLNLTTANIYVSETYWVQMDDPYLYESETIPKFIGLYGTATDGAHFTGYITCLTERPTEDWLSQFGLREYIETEVS